MKKVFLAGSTYFFQQYPDFHSKDKDFIIINDELSENYWHIYDEDNKADIFYWKKNTPEWHVEYLLRPRAFSLDLGHLLIPEVNQELGFTIEHLKQLEPVIQKMESQLGHHYDYNKILFYAYIKNNGFFLTDEQRWHAYQIYKKERQEDNNLED